MIALANKAYLANADFRGPRVDWRDLEEHSAGQLICLTGGPLRGVLTPLIEQAADPSNPVEAAGLASRLNELYPHVYVELAYYGQPREKLVNRGLVALAQRLELKDAARQVWQRLMDAVDEDLLDRAEAAARSAEGVEDVSEVRARWIGHSIHAEALITADCDLTLADAHAVAERARHAMLHAVPKLASVTVHVDPCSHRGVDHHADLAHHQPGARAQATPPSLVLVIARRRGGLDNACRWRERQDLVDAEPPCRNECRAEMDRPGLAPAVRVEHPACDHVAQPAAPGCRAADARRGDTAVPRGPPGAARLAGTGDRRPRRRRVGTAHRCALRRCRMPRSRPPAARRPSSRPVLSERSIADSL
jgi:hypothetical protein